MISNSNREKVPIKNAVIFTEIYNNNAWGGQSGDYYSGEGSHNKYVFGYAEIVADFVKKNNIYKIVEIGCGDFFVTFAILKLLDTVNYKYSYTGYDVVEGLIENNISNFSSPKIKFKCLDPSLEKIPRGELLLVRQVLQHLNNDSIKNIVQKFNLFKFVLFTEHQLTDSRFTVPNRDKITNDLTRLPYNSGVYLDLPPFNCSIDELVYSFPKLYKQLHTSINTFLIKN